MNPYDSTVYSVAIHPSTAYVVIRWHRSLRETRCHVADVVAVRVVRHTAAPLSIAVEGGKLAIHRSADRNAVVHTTTGETDALIFEVATCEIESADVSEHGMYGI